MKKIMVRSTALVLSIVFVCISFCECNTNSEERKKSKGSLVLIRFMNITSRRNVVLLTN